MYKPSLMKESKKPEEQSNSTFRLVIIIFAVSAVLAGFVILRVMKTTKKIGTVYGTEHEYIKIDDVVYQANENTGLQLSDKDKLIGKVVFEEIPDADPMYVWTIKGEENSDYIYALWGSTGNFYQKVKQ